MTRETLLVMFVRANTNDPDLLDVILDCFYDASERDWLLWTESLSPDFDRSRLNALSLLFGLTPLKTETTITKYNLAVAEAIKEFV